jgi:hypothetical protein
MKKVISMLLAFVLLAGIFGALPVYADWSRNLNSYVRNTASFRHSTGQHTENMTKITSVSELSDYYEHFLEFHASHINWYDEWIPTPFENEVFLNSAYNDCFFEENFLILIRYVHTRNDGVFNRADIFERDGRLNVEIVITYTDILIPLPVAGSYLLIEVDRALVDMELSLTIGNRTIYRFNVTSTIGGRVSGSGMIRDGEDVTVTATPFSGYTFDGWYVRWWQQECLYECWCEGEELFMTDSVFTFLFRATDIPGMRLQARFIRTSDGGPDTRWFTGHFASYVISNHDQLAGLATLVNNCINFAGKTIHLGADIDLDAYGKDYNDGKGWIPIGNPNAVFSGTFNGNGRTIRGLFINDPDRDNAGLFGAVSGGMITRVEVVDANITAGNNTGAIVGSFDNGIIANCLASGSVTGNSKVGGIVGSIVAGDIKNCFSGVVVSGTQVVGGVFGHIIGTTMSPFGEAANNYAGAFSIRGTNTEFIARIGNFNSPYAYSGITVPGRLSNNHARGSMTKSSGSPIDRGHDRPDGVNSAEIGNLSAFFWTGTLGWDTSIWHTGTNQQPSLRVSTPPANRYIFRGDVSGDGVVCAADIVMLREYLSRSYNLFFAMENFCILSADINGDGVVNAADVTLLRRLLSSQWVDL